MRGVAHHLKALIGGLALLSWRYLFAAPIATARRVTVGSKLLVRVQVAQVPLRMALRTYDASVGQ